MLIETFDSDNPIVPEHAGLAAALAWLRQTDLNTLPLGRHEIQGDDVFAMIEDYTTKLEADGVWETHAEHADIQLLLAGQERIGWVADTSTVSLSEDRRPDADVCFFSPPAQPLWVTLCPGMFVLIPPGELHGPCRALAAPSDVRKMVVKIRW